MLAAKMALALLALVGHAALCIGSVNRIHATGLPRWLIKVVSLFFYAALAAGTLAIAWWIAEAIVPSRLPAMEPRWSGPLAAYAWLCAGVAVIQTSRWAFYRRRYDTTSAVKSERFETIDVAGRLGKRPVHGWYASVMSRLPGNELLTITLRERVLAVPGLPAALEGLSILHLSDLHFSGRIGREYFHEVIAVSAAADCDLVALTGDVCDVAACIGWIEPILGGLKARLGKYFVLGNHDVRVRDVRGLRAALERAGFVDLGGNCAHVTCGDATLLLAGNELPWLPPAAELGPQCRAETHQDLRVLLSHSPDQFGWAEAFGFDLTLAGHTHGGQIRLPLIGSVVCPSLYGTRYACGTFQHDRALMHVSRGVSSLTPVRLNCPPEVIKLVLTAASVEPAQTEARSAGVAR